MKKVCSFCLLFAFLQALLQIPAAAQTVEERPYLITLAVTDGSSGFGNTGTSAITPSEPQIESQTGKALEYCRTFIGTRWNIKAEYPEKKIVPADIDWNKLNTDKFNTDKLFLFSLNYSGNKIDNFSFQEIDVQTRRFGIEKHYGLDSLEKLPDLLFQALLKHFSPFVVMESSTPQQAVFRIQGGGIPVLSAVPLPLFPADSVLIPFVRTLDREGNTVSVEPVPYTVLIAEAADNLTERLTCRIVSGLPNALSVKRRGRTEIIAAGLSIAGQEEMRATLLKLKLPDSVKPVPVYDIYEVFPEDKNKEKEERRKPLKIGQSGIDGIFELSAEPERLLRVIQIRSGNSLFAQFPVVRSLQNEITVPVADAPVRSEAESYLKGLQDEFIDTLAKRIILQKRLEKIKQKADGSADNNAAERKVQNDIMNLKSNDDFLNGLEQGQQRFRSEIPAVQHRIDRMFRETEKAFRQQSAVPENTSD